jgi:hypothetical protein
MKTNTGNKQNAKNQARNAKAAELLRGLSDKQLAAVSGGACGRNCGIMISLDAQTKAIK